MRRVGVAVCLLALVAGINPILYRPVPCGEAPTISQLGLEALYFVVQNLAALLLILEVRKTVGKRYTLPGIVLLCAKIGMEVFPLVGLPVNGYLASTFFMAVFTYVLILILKWETFLKK